MAAIIIIARIDVNFFIIYRFKLLIFCFAVLNILLQI